MTFDPREIDKKVDADMKHHRYNLDRKQANLKYQIRVRIAALIMMALLFIVITTGSLSIYQWAIRSILTKSEVVPSLQMQEKVLSDAKQSLESLSSYLDAQSKSLKQTEAAVAALKQREQELTPLVKAQQDMVDKLFVEQERRNIQALERERWIGAAIGILTSLLSTLIIYLTRNFWFKWFKRAKPE